MQKTVYTCDCPCKRVIGEKPHISLVLQTNHAGCGIAIPPLKRGDTHTGMYTHWSVRRFPQNFVHFINEEHLARYFKRQLEDATKCDEKPKGKK